MNARIFFFFSFFVFALKISVSQTGYVHNSVRLPGEFVDLIDNEDGTSVNYLFSSHLDSTVIDNVHYNRISCKRYGFLSQNDKIHLFPLNDYYLFHYSNTMFFKRRISDSSSNLIKAVLTSDSTINETDLGELCNYCGMTLLNEKLFFAEDYGEGIGSKYSLYNTENKLITEYIPYPENFFQYASYDFNEKFLGILTQQDHSSIFKVAIFSLNNGQIKDTFSLKSIKSPPFIKIAGDILLIYFESVTEAYSFKGNFLWKQKNISPMWSGEIRYDDRDKYIFIINNHKSILCLNAKNGSILWKLDAGSLIRSTANENETKYEFIDDLIYSSQRSLLIMSGKRLLNTKINGGYCEYFLLMVDKNGKTINVSNTTSEILNQNNENEISSSGIRKASTGFILFKNKNLIRYQLLIR